MLLLVASLAPFVVLATGVAASPFVTRGSPISLSITRHTNATGTLNFIQSDRSRLIKLANGAPIPNDTLNGTIGGYVASIGIGTPPTYYNLLVDTESANTWVGANKPYEKTSSSVKTNNSVNAGYFSGQEYIDTVTIAPGVTISQQSIGVASASNGFYPLDGALGIGPKDLSLDTLEPQSETLIPTVTDNLFQQGTIDQDLVALSSEPMTSAWAMNGELTFGGTDPTKYTGNITYFPLTNTLYSSNYWGVNASFRYGDTIILDTSAGIIDASSRLIYLGPESFDNYIGATGGELDNDTGGFLRINVEQYAKLQSLFFSIGGSHYELTPNAQIWPRALNGLINGTADDIYLSVQLFQADTPGLEFICGMAFLERFYTVFDTGHRLLGLATTQFTHADTN